MSESAERGSQYPFRISYDKDSDWSDLTIDVELKEPASSEQKQELEEMMAGWANEGIDKGYKEGLMHDWNKEGNEWDKKDRRLRFWVDMGSSGEDALNVLFEKLKEIKQVERVRLGSRYYD